MTTQEIEVVLADVDQKIATEGRITNARGIDLSWRARTYRWRLNSLHRALIELSEYNKHEHFKHPSLLRNQQK
jgi:hypothetical protein